MIPIDGRPILTAAQVRAAEAGAIAGGATVESLMERAGAGVAEAVRRLAAGARVIVLCGPGNNGGDGYVAARILHENGVDVRIAATGEPTTAAAIAARRGWAGPIGSLGTCEPAPVLVDAVFGTGLSRVVDAVVPGALDRLMPHANLSIAVDLPSGLDTDSGAVLMHAPPPFHITLALGAVKPVYVLPISAEICGVVRLIDFGFRVDPRWNTTVTRRPSLGTPPADATKFTRGMVAVVGGALPGASALAAEAAMRCGAGYVLLLSDTVTPGTPHALVRREWSPEALADPRIDAVVIGPGLGRDAGARGKLEAVLAGPHAVIIDGDALHLLDGRTFHERSAPVIVTPHGGEFEAAFGGWSGSKIDAARAAAARSGATVVFKGAQTVVADPSGIVVVSPHGPSWLSSAGTGDVLAGAVGAMMASLRDSSATARIAAVDAAVWMHAAAARRLGGAFVADDLARALSAVRGSL